PVEELVRHPKVVDILRKGLQQHNAGNPGSSFQIRRAILLTEPPSIDGNELTDKGYINQRATLERRSALVEALFAEAPGPEVVVA
ncbi:MAG: acyl-CoA synthetase, partial [Reyranellaceae bacterium]